MSSPTVTVLTTVGNLRQARRMAHAVLEQQLAACVHISAIESLYRWRGKLQQEREFQLSLHTSDARAAALQALLLELHPYELPSISVTAAQHVHAPYARWVIDNSAPTRARRSARKSAKGRTAHRP